MHVIRHFHPLHFELRFLQNEIKNSDELVQRNVTHIIVFFFFFFKMKAVRAFSDCGNI